MAVPSMAGRAAAPVGLEGRPVYELRGVSKTFAQAQRAGARQGRSHAARGHLLGDHRPERLRQVDPAQDHGRAAAALGRAASSSQGKPVTGPRRDIGMMFQQATLFPWRTTHREHRAADRDPRRQGRRPGPSTPGRASSARTSSAWTASRTSTRASCRAAWRSGRRSAGC